MECSFEGSVQYYGSEQNNPSVVQHMLHAMVSLEKFFVRVRR